MLSWVQIIPPWLVGVTLLIVVMPTIIAIGIRYQLYRYLTDLVNKVSRLLEHQSPGLKPTILEKLEFRYADASRKLEHVNTAALVDTVYSQEYISVLGMNFRCDQAENFCRTLPNLLLAFGLLGTFIGITANLYNIGEAIRVSEAGADIEVFIQKLQPHLQGMGVAFFTSLVAIFCSSFLTSVNLRLNTSAVKYYLIGYLEDYLDNIFKPTVEGDTRLDRAVNRMVQHQEYFLTNFHQKVGLVLEDTFGRSADKIAKESIKANQLAERIYNELSESSGQIRTGAETFRTSAEIFKDAATILRDSKTAVKAWKVLHDQFESSISRFGESTKTMHAMVTTLDESNKAMQKVGEQVLDLSRQSVQVAQSTCQQTQTLNGIITQAQQELENVFDEFKNTIHQLEGNLENLSGKWIGASSQQLKTYSHQGEQLLGKMEYNLQQLENNQQALTQLIATITVLESNLKQLMTTSTKIASQQLDTNSRYGKELLEKMDQHLVQFANTQQTLSQLVESIKTMNIRVDSRSDQRNSLSKPVRGQVTQIPELEGPQII